MSRHNALLWRGKYSNTLLKLTNNFSLGRGERDDDALSEVKKLELRCDALLVECFTAPPASASSLRHGALVSKLGELNHRITGEWIAFNCLFSYSFAALRQRVRGPEAAYELGDDVRQDVAARVDVIVEHVAQMRRMLHPDTVSDGPGGDAVSDMFIELVRCFLTNRRYFDAIAARGCV